LLAFELKTVQMKKYFIFNDIVKSYMKNNEKEH